MTEVITDEAPGKTDHVTVSRQIHHPIKQVWQVLVTGAGAEALLGQGARLGEKGHTWRSSAGTHGVVRSFHPLEQIRFSWHAGEDAPATIVEVRLSPVDEDQTLIELSQCHLYDGLSPEAAERRLEAALARIETDAF